MGNVLSTLRKMSSSQRTFVRKSLFVQNYTSLKQTSYERYLSHKKYPYLQNDLTTDSRLK